MSATIYDRKCKRPFESDLSFKGSLYSRSERYQFFFVTVSHFGHYYLTRPFECWCVDIKGSLYSRQRGSSLFFVTGSRVGHYDREYNRHFQSDSNIKWSLFSRSEWYQFVLRQLHMSATIYGREHNRHFESDDDIKGSLYSRF